MTEHVDLFQTRVNEIYLPLTPGLLIFIINIILVVHCCTSLVTIFSVFFH